MKINDMSATTASVAILLKLNNRTTSFAYVAGRCKKDRWRWGGGGGGGGESACTCLKITTSIRITTSIKYNTHHNIIRLNVCQARYWACQ